MKRKLLSILMALSMALTLLPMTALAVEGDAASGRVALSSLTKNTNIDGEKGWYDNTQNSVHLAYTYYEDKMCYSAGSTAGAADQPASYDVHWVKSVTITGINFNELTDGSEDMTKLNEVILNGRRTDTPAQFKDSIEVKFVDCSFNQTNSTLQVYKIMPCNATKFSFDGCAFNQSATGQYAITLNVAETGYDSRAISYEIINSTIDSAERGINIIPGTETQTLGTHKPNVVISGNTFTLPTRDPKNMAVQIAGVWDNADLNTNSDPLIQIENNNITAYAVVRIHSSMSGNTGGSAKYIAQLTNNTLTNGTIDVVPDGDNETTKAIAAYYNAVVNNGFAAEINGTKYLTLAEAVAAVPASGVEPTTIVLCHDSAGEGIVVDNNKNIIFDFNDKTYTLKGKAVGSLNTKTNGFQLIKGSTVVFKNGTLKIDESNLTEITDETSTNNPKTLNNFMRMIQSYANVTIEDMTIDATYQYGGKAYVMSFNHDIVSIKGNTKIIGESGKVVFDSDNGKWGGYDKLTPLTKVTIETTNEIIGNIEVTRGGLEIKNINLKGEITKGSSDTPNANISITGGTFNNNPSAYVASGHDIVKNSDETYTVVGAMTKVEAKPATCTEEGNHEYWAWGGNKYNRDATNGVYMIKDDADVTIPASGHSFSGAYAFDETGHWHKCDRCDAIDEKMAHTFDTTDCSKAATCSDCGYVKLAGVHTWGVGEVTKAATCKEAGEMTYTCTACGATKTEVIPMSDEHTLEFVAKVPATCGESGTEAYYKCSVCGRMFKDTTCDVEYPEYPPAIRPTGEHTFGDWTVTKQATYTEEGERAHTCTVCNRTETETIAKLTPSSSGSSSSGSTTTKTETTTNPDGSTTKTETKADGTTVETTTNTDGSTTTTETKTETKADGSTVETKSETSTAADGSKTESKTETTTAPDGSKTETKTETKTAADGTKTETEAKTETKADGTTASTETSKTTDVNGSTGTTTTTTENGNTKTEAEAKISEKAVEDAKKNDAPVTAPVEVKAGENSNSAPTVKIELPENAGETKIEIPVSDVNSGTVAVIVNEDGTEEIVKNSIVTENGVVLGVEGSATVKIIDNSKDFIDTENHWSRDEVNFVASRELFNGIGNNLFGVSGDMTRGMVNTVLARLAGEDTNGGANWYDKGTEWAKKNGITDGTNPTANVTREQLAAMLYRFAGSPKVSGELSFADADQISGYAKDALLWAVQNGILNGIGNNLVAPTAGAERAQVAAMMARYLKNVG